MLAIVPTPLVRSQQTESRLLGINRLLERKDTYMLNLHYPLSGPYAWDIPHENRSSQDSDRCIKSAAAMIDAYYGGNLSQDRIAYHVYHEVLQWKSPEDDLGDPAQGIIDLNIVNVLFWELSGANVVRIMGKPGFSELKYWIDLNIPVVRDAGGTSHLITVIDGYDTDGQMVYVIDPLDGTETKVPYDSLPVFVVWAIMGSQITARSDEPSIWMDSDGDGVVDFDETNRFGTDPYNNDTYGLGINDKTAIKYMYMDHLAFPTATFRYSPETPLINEPILFDASENMGSITAYTWKFGDSSITTAAVPTISHAYSQPGTYNVTLTVNDSNGLWNTTTSSVTVEVQNQNASEAAFYRQSLDRKGYASTEGPGTPDLLWTSYVNDSVTTSPIVSDGKVFAGTSSGRLYALNLTDGETVWTFDAGSPISSSPAVQDGVVYFGTGSPGGIYAVDAQTGFARWLYQVPSGAAVYSSPAVIDDKVIVGCSDGNLLCLDQLDGHVLWKSHISGGYISSPAIQNSTIFVSSNEGIHAVDMLTGTQIWEHATSWPVTSCPSVADGLVFIGLENNDRVYALDQNNGNLVWSFWTGGWLTPTAVDSSRQLVIAGSKDYRLYCLEEFTGSLKWQYISGPNYLSAQTISANGLVYVGTSDGNFRCINETDGKQIWEYNVNSSIASSPSIIPEHVLVGTQEGKIYCFGPAFPVSNSTSAPDIALSDLTISMSEVVQGHSLQINATAENHGDSTQIFNITAYANGTAIETRETTVTNGTSVTEAFTWNTSGFAAGNYTISAFAWPVPGETNVADNNRTSPTAVRVYVGTVDLAITNVTSLKTVVGQGYSDSINVTVANQGQVSMTSNVTAYANQTVIGTFLNVNLASGDSAILIFTWNTTVIMKGNFTIYAYVDPLPFEANTLDNNYTSPTTVRVGMPGDIVSPFGVIDMKDVAYVAKRFNTDLSSPSWDPNADINGDNKVDMKDVAIVAKNFGKHDP
jgi:outer membrane protein assembly factor BamB